MEPIHLWVKVKVGRQTFGLRWIYPAELVLNYEFRNRRLPVFVQDLKSHLCGGKAYEIQGHLVAEAEVLSSLAYVEGKSSRSFSSIP